MVICALILANVLNVLMVINRKKDWDHFGVPLSCEFVDSCHKFLFGVVDAGSRPLVVLAWGAWILFARCVFWV